MDVVLLDCPGQAHAHCQSLSFYFATLRKRKKYRQCEVGRLYQQQLEKKQGLSNRLYKQRSDRQAHSLLLNNCMPYIICNQFATPRPTKCAVLFLRGLMARSRENFTLTFTVPQIFILQYHIVHSYMFRSPRDHRQGIKSKQHRTKGPCHGSGGQLPASHRGGPGSISGQSVWDLWWTKWHWDRYFPKYFGFPLSFSFHRCSITCKYEKN